METREHILLLLENISRVLVGREDTTRRSVIALLAGGHVLLEDLPGTAPRDRKDYTCESPGQVSRGTVHEDPVHPGPSPV